jgi:Fe-S-cluster containining protein
MKAGSEPFGLAASEINVAAGAAHSFPEELQGRRVLGQNEQFRFGCHAGLACFTRCCGDANILLTPIDVLRLARRLGVTTTEFLDKHALVPITRQLHLPVVMLRMGDDPDKRCPFVGEQGCAVYQDRPWSCRMFPLGMALPPARAGVEPQPVYFLCEHPFCEGPSQQQAWTVQDWRGHQGAVEQEEIEKGYREIVAHPWFIGGRRLDPKRIEIFHMACYDLDKFRRFVFESTFLERFELDPQFVEQLRNDDHALLSFAFCWLRFALFSESTLKVRNSAPSEATNE